MPLSYKPFSELSSADLERLQNNAVPEGLRIDYKRDSYPAKEGREFLKDLSSFANSDGGYLLIGVDEKNGLVDSIPGVDVATIDDEIQRLENWARDGIEPRILGVQMRRIDISEKNSVIAISVPKSLNPPHRVSSQNTNRFFVRNSSGKHEASVEELRRLFGFSARLSDAVQSFVSERRDKITTGRDIVSDYENGRLIVHVINASTFGDSSFVDVKKLYADPYHFRGPQSGSITRRMTLEGVLVGSEAEGRFWDRTIVFRDGSIETVHTNLYWQPRDQILIPGLSLMENLIHAIDKSLKGLNSLGATGPFSIAVGLQTTKGMPIAFFENTFRGYPVFDRDFVELPLLTLTEFDPSSPIHDSIRPVLDNLWNSVGLPECGYFKDGKWNPRN